MSQKLLAFVTIALSVTLAWLVARAARPGDVPPRAALAPDAGAARLDELEARLRRLEQRGTAGPELVVPEPQRAVAIDGGGSERLTELEERLATVEGALAGGPPPRSRSHELGAAPRHRGLRDMAELRQEVEQELEAERREAAEERARAEAKHEALRRHAQDLFADPNATALAQVQAQGALRRVPDAYTDAMVTGLVEIGLNDPEPSLRADVWRNFDGTTAVPAIVPHLIHAASYDADSRVRAEAAETLGNYKSDPTALDVLRHLAEHDPDAAVRRKALRSLDELR